MIRTPTYYAFQMYAVHHDATLLGTDLTCGTYTFEGESMPAMNVSASRDKAGAVHVSLCNFDPKESRDVEGSLTGMKASGITGIILSAQHITDHNSFERPGVVQPVPFAGARLTDDGFALTLPAKSVVVLEIP
jgi:alpha-N-arabinofuranosidase